MSNFKLPKGPDVYWEKWVDPYKLSIDEIEWNEFDEENPNEKLELQDLPSHKYAQDFENDGDSSDAPRFVQTPGIKHLFTPFGIIPLTEHTHPGKLFKFWTGHSNFSLTKELAILMADIPGIETLNIWTRYRFRIGIGKLFDDKVVMFNLKEAMVKYYKAKHGKTHPQPTLDITGKSS